jgi:hypothetical protein
MESGDPAKHEAESEPGPGRKRIRLCDMPPAVLGDVFGYLEKMSMQIALRRSGYGLLEGFDAAAKNQLVEGAGSFDGVAWFPLALSWRRDHGSETSVLRMPLVGLRMNGGAELPGVANASRDTLEVLDVGPRITTLGYGFAKGCSKLSHLSISNSVRTVGFDFAYGCAALRSLELGTGVMDIPPRFANFCTSLTEVEVPEDSVRNLRDAGRFRINSSAVAQR